jgi:hypothetical protein
VRRGVDDIRARCGALSERGGTESAGTVSHARDEKEAVEIIKEGKRHGVRDEVVHPLGVRGGDELYIVGTVSMSTSARERLIWDVRGRAGRGR